MANVPNWLLGRHTYSVITRLQSVSIVDGAVTNGAAAETWTGIVDEIQFSGMVNTENITNLTSDWDNEVPIENDNTFVLTEILQQSGAATKNYLARLWDAASDEHVLITISRGATASGTTGNAFFFTGLITEYTESIRRGKCVARMTVKQINGAAAGVTNGYTTYVVP